MAYKLIVTEHANELLNDLVYHLIFRLKSEQAAKLQFPYSKDTYLAKKGYRGAVVPKMNYVVIFEVGEDRTVNVLGVFHQLENYQSKL